MSGWRKRQIAELMERKRIRDGLDSREKNAYNHYVPENDKVVTIKEEND